MVNITDLRIGNLVYNIKTKTQMAVSGISEQGYVIYKNDLGGYDNISVGEIEALILDQICFDKLRNQGIIQAGTEENIFYFSGSTTTYFLVYDNEEGNFFIGMIDVDLPKKYRRITRPFVEFHKMQNAFFAIYNKELNKIK